MTKEAKLIVALENLANLMEDVHDACIYDTADPHPDDCVYCAAVSDARAALAAAQ